MHNPQIPGHGGYVTLAGDGIKRMPVVPAGLGEVSREASAGRALQMDLKGVDAPTAVLER